MSTTVCYCCWPAGACVFVLLVLHGCCFHRVFVVVVVVVAVVAVAAVASVTAALAVNNG